MEMLKTFVSISNISFQHLAQVFMSLTLNSTPANGGKFTHKNIIISPLKSDEGQKTLTLCIVEKIVVDAIRTRSGAAK